MWIEGILVNIVSWLLTVLVGVAFAILYSKYRRLKDTQIDKKVLNETLDIIKIYPTRQDAIRDQLSNLIKAQEINILAYNGFALIDAPVFVDSSLHKIVSKWTRSGTKKFNLLLLNPSETNVIKTRIERLDLEYVKPTNTEIERDKQDIIRNTKTFLETNDNYKNLCVDLGYFNSDLIWHIILFDRYILLSFYQEGTTAKFARTLLISNTSLLGKSMSNYFQYMWRKRDAVNQTNSKIPSINKEDKNED